MSKCFGLAEAVDDPIPDRLEEIVIPLLAVDRGPDVLSTERFPKDTRWCDPVVPLTKLTPSPANEPRDPTVDEAVPKPSALFAVPEPTTSLEPDPGADVALLPTAAMVCACSIVSKRQEQINLHPAEGSPIRQRRQCWTCRLPCRPGDNLLPSVWRKVTRKRVSKLKIRIKMRDKWMIWRGKVKHTQSSQYLKQKIGQIRRD